ncbi:putative malate:quinone oxidoreductase [Actinobacillus minor 202]|uniref:Probable malate:quinone oxidoreductase n=1 Tax=Actinobacillus minor 202 TaxID=591023 RepID=A0ABP2DLX2_9PAST|nr:malate dehydrogenase (quinone) [Actinobacillus minor]EEF15935.1 putative malate:quinone oxidoreductase [Actinobacillus minor 202]
METSITQSDVVLIGAGVMSGTLGTFLKELAPSQSITIFEGLSQVALESSNEWNNAGTGHAALCELNYTAEKADGSVDISKAIAINEKYQLSLEMWSYLVEKGYLQNPQQFIRKIPHMSFVQGENNITFLKKRFEQLSQNPLFENMQFSEDPETLKHWIPLMMDNRNAKEAVAATYIENGTDVNFGELTRKLFQHLTAQGCQLHLNHKVTDIQKSGDGWLLTIQNASGQILKHLCKFLFIGGGGGTLPLLQKTGIKEGKHVGGFPVSGIFMVCRNPEVVEKHHAKVYGKAKIGAPPMSVPHLDTRFIDGKKTLLFGPFAGFTFKFLKTGSICDFPASFKPGNLLTMHIAGLKNIPLTHYLIKQALLTKEQRMADLREFVPDAKSEDWEVIIAGQRVQIIKDLPNAKGSLCFGTEVIASEDNTVAALLGASPGASTSVDAMLGVLEKCFADKLPEWKEKLTEMMPSYGKSLREEPDLIQVSRAKVVRFLGL